MKSTRIGRGPGGFINIAVSRAEADHLVEMMTSRIRRLCRSESPRPSHFSDISRMARLCFVVTSSTEYRTVILTRLSREDVESLYALPHDERSEKVLNDLNEARSADLTAGPTDLEVSDLAAKSVYEVMEG